MSYFSVLLIYTGIEADKSIPIVLGNLSSRKVVTDSNLTLLQNGGGGRGRSVGDVRVSSSNLGIYLFSLT